MQVRNRRPFVGYKLTEGDGKYDVYYTFSEQQSRALQLSEWNVGEEEAGYIYIDCVVYDEYRHVLSYFGYVEAYYEDNSTVRIILQ